MLSWLVHCLLVLLSVAFFTLFERKVIGLFHLRLGPNKVSLLGLVQPLLDAFKLLTKQNLHPLQANKLTYSVSPLASLLLRLFVWISLPLLFTSFSVGYSLIIFFLVGSIMVFAVLLSGWASNSKYSLLGRLRSIAQSVSYESVFRTLLVLMGVLLMSYSVLSSLSLSRCLFIPLLPLWFICTLAETHRAPFDFAEAESELVSGFNTEYSGAFFAFIFLSEYRILLYSCMLITYLFFRWLGVASGLRILVGALSISYIFIWVRITFCRFRYDLLMSVAWKTLLPIALLGFIYFVVVV